jgi:hypothetical protein
MTSPFDALPHTTITASMLPFVSTDDWLQFRAASRSCYEMVHGTTNVSHGHCSLCQSTRHLLHEEASDANNSLNEEAENLWKLALVRDYRFQMGGDDLLKSIHSPKDEYGRERHHFLSTEDVFTASTSFQSWKHWRKIEARRGIKIDYADGGHLVYYRNTSRCTNPFRQTVGPYYLRAASMWKTIEEWCGQGDDEQSSLSPLGLMKTQIKDSLVPGVDVTRPMHRCQFEDDDLITALSAVYSFYSGQRTTGSNPYGLFGGYSAYNQGCLMELHHFGPYGYIVERDKGSFTIAVDSFRNLMHSIKLELKTGHLSICNPRTREKILAVKNYQSEDELLVWFEEYARRLSTNYYSYGQFIPRSRYMSILHYPSVTAAECSRAVTRGIEIVASSTFDPISHTLPQGMHIYSIRMRILTAGDGNGHVPPEERGFTTCQLHSRHWLITKQVPDSEAEETTVEEVRGEGVVGEYPLLVEGGFRRYTSHNGADTFALLDDDSFARMDISMNETGTFTYQSCTDRASTILEGYLTFVPGSLRNPYGDPFQVRVAPFKLCSQPDFYY